MSKREKTKANIYTKILITRKIPLEIKHVDKNISNTLLKILNDTFAGKCIDEGYVRADSINIISYSSGLVRANVIVFEVVFECFVCYLVEGMEITCVAKNITKAGIRAELNMDISPVVIFVARDHHYVSPLFNKVVEGDEIVVKIIGQRFELNDINICAIAELLKLNTGEGNDISSKIEKSASSNASKSATSSTSKSAPNVSKASVSDVAESGTNLTPKTRKPGRPPKQKLVIKEDD